jgi:DNA-binding MarR family transcriptional regulator
MQNNYNPNLASVMLTAMRLMRECVSGHGKTDPFSMAEFKVLALAANKEKPTMKDIAESLYITSPSATPIIDRLVETKKLRRIYDENDRRIVRLEITKKGQEEFCECRKEIDKKMDNVLSILNKKEQAELLKILTKIINGKTKVSGKK